MFLDAHDDIEINHFNPNQSSHLSNLSVKSIQLEKNFNIEILSCFLT